MLKQYENYLIDNNYKQNTVHAYTNSVKKICEEENITVLYLSKNIDKYVEMYDKGGIKSDKGCIGHDTWINALKRFREFTYKTTTKFGFDRQKTQTDKFILSAIKELAENGLKKALSEKNTYYEDIFTKILKKTLSY